MPTHSTHTHNTSYQHIHSTYPPVYAHSLNLLVHPLLQNTLSTLSIDTPSQCLSHTLSLFLFLCLPLSLHVSLSVSAPLSSSACTCASVPVCLILFLSACLCLSLSPGRGRRCWLLARVARTARRGSSARGSHLLQYMCPGTYR